MSAEPLYPGTPDEGEFQKKKKKRRSTRKHKVHPQSNGDINTELDLEMRLTGVNNTQGGEGEKRKSAADIFRVGQKVKEGVDRFKEMNTKKWKQSVAGGARQGVLGIEREAIPDPFKPNPQNEEMISYFAQLAMDTNEETSVDLELVQSLIERGASPNCTDKHGQTILLEACRAWETDVALFLIEKGADVNKADLLGRTALHVAAAVDYPEMIKLLIQQGADIEALTQGENQTPMHYAARNDACNALSILVKNKADIHPKDYKGRTPLQIAAELDRSETAKLLLELGADASDIDESQLPALVLMITKMPAVASFALDQLHRMDRPNRKQYFFLHHLEPTKPDDKEPNSRTALQVVVQYNQLDLIMHPVFQRLIEIKWHKYGKFGAAKQVLISIAYILIWTIIALTLEEPVVYEFPQDIWRLVLGLSAVALTVLQIYQELQEFFQSKKEFMLWKKWRISEIKKDFLYCHPRWPQEEMYLQSEIDAIKDQSPDYFSDSWNYFDWFVYAILTAVATMHTVDVFVDAEGLSAVTKRIFAVAIIFIWLRFMKTARASQSLGPFIVMLGHIAVDLARFLFLYLEFYIPYACAFWMIYGNNTEVKGMATVDELMFTLFRMTLVDEYDYDGMNKVDAVMAYILVTTFLMLSAILCLNLLIALLSDTFQRVYDNAKSNAVMQQASIILAIEEGLSKKKLRKFRNHIHTNCAPDTLFYDDDQTSTEGEDLKKVTFQIKDVLDELAEKLGNDNTLKNAAETATSMHEDIGLLHSKQDKYSKQMKRMKQDMKELKQMVASLISAHNNDASSDRRQSTIKSSSTHPGSSSDNSSDNDDPPSRPRFVQKRTSTPRMTTPRASKVHASRGYQVRSPDDNPPLGLESILSQDFTLGPHKFPSVLLPSHEEPHIDEAQRLQQLRKEKKKQQRLRQEQEMLFQQQREEGVDTHDGTASSHVPSISVRASVELPRKSDPGNGGDSNC